MDWILLGISIVFGLSLEFGLSPVFGLSLSFWLKVVGLVPALVSTWQREGYIQPVLLVCTHMHLLPRRKLRLNTAWTKIERNKHWLWIPLMLCTTTVPCMMCTSYCSVLHAVALYALGALFCVTALNWMQSTLWQSVLSVHYCVLCAVYCQACCVSMLWSQQCTVCSLYALHCLLCTVCQVPSAFDARE